MDKAITHQLTLPVSNDPLLRYWARCATSGERGYLSNTTRLALEHYISHQSFLEIARLCVPDEDMNDYPENIVFRYNMSPNIIGWLEEVKKAGIAGIDAVRYVLHGSIATVTAKDEESLINRDVVYRKPISSADFERLLHETTVEFASQTNLK